MRRLEPKGIQIFPPKNGLYIIEMVKYGIGG